MIRIRAFSIVLAIAAVVQAAGDPALIRIGRLDAGDRGELLAAGIPVVKEFGGFLLAFGPAEGLVDRLDARGFPARVLDRPRPGESYHLLGLRDGYAWPVGPGCGVRIWNEEDTVIVKTAGPGRPDCAAGPALRWSPLPLERLSPVKPAAGKPRKAMEALPLVSEMVDSLGDAEMAGTLEEVVGWASSRYSFHSGCRASTEAARAAFAAAGLSVQLQEWSTKYPPNVIAELRGETRPEEVTILIAHLDDMPERPPAPGADDNASGSAMVLALARAMAPYRFAGTLKFILTTGEEQGLVGATIYARDAELRQEDILAVLDADMIGWEGDGRPTGEDIDINYDLASEWLGELMVVAAGMYGTGGPVNAFPCPGMVYSDHAPFWDRGWSAVCGITDNEGSCGQKGSYPYYHTHDDTIANCGDLSFFAGAGRTYLATAAELAVPLGRRDGAGGHPRPLVHP